MKPIHVLSVRSLVAALCCALGLVFLMASNAKAADKAPSLPVTATFEKVTTDGVSGYALNLKNDSADALKVTVTITPSVVFHADAKVKTLPAHAIDAGQVWTIKDLAAGDKLSVAADGFAKLELTVP